MSDRWDPSQYERYRGLRERPLMDLMALALETLRTPSPSIVDLGAGTCRGTLKLHAAAKAARTVAVDSSAAMVERGRSTVGAAGDAGNGVEIIQRDIVDFTRDPQQRASWDLVFSNAALHWIDDHDSLFPQLVQLIRPGGVLAVQVPNNEAHPSHAMLRRVASEPPFVEALGGWTRNSPVLAPSRYAALLHGLGLEDATVLMRVYPQVVAGAGGIVEWVRGSVVTAYQRRLSEPVFEAFVDRYITELSAELGVSPTDASPLFYPYDRVFLAARRP